MLQQNCNNQVEQNAFEFLFFCIECFLNATKVEWHISIVIENKKKIQIT